MCGGGGAVMRNLPPGKTMSCVPCVGALTHTPRYARCDAHIAQIGGPIKTRPQGCSCGLPGRTHFPCSKGGGRGEHVQGGGAVGRGGGGGHGRYRDNGVLDLQFLSYSLI